ncbi:MAG: hypothetical protein HQM13_10435 [SAR324 cluster bacterium]|nr:hypothetical protein [SAR324 cluster bacterium]
MKRSTCFCGRQFVIGMILLGGFLFFNPSFLMAQQAPDPAGEAAADGTQDTGDGVEGQAAGGEGFSSDEPFFRFSVMTEMFAMRFDDPHPFKQMTGSKKFDDTIAVPQTGLEFGSRVNFQEDNGDIQPIFRALPSFSIEYVIPVDLFVISGASIEYYHTSTLHLDAVVAFNATGPKSQTPLIKMQTYYDFLSVSAHFFNPGEEGYDIFVGLGVANIDGAYEGGFRGRIENDYVRTVETVNFDAFPISFKKVGLDVIGDIWTFRFTTLVFSRAEVITKNVFVGNELTPDANETINFDGLILRAALLFRCKYFLCFF